jgi:hypothetical protein
VIRTEKQEMMRSGHLEGGTEGRDHIKTSEDIVRVSRTEWVEKHCRVLNKEAMWSEWSDLCLQPSIWRPTVQWEWENYRSLRLVIQITPVERW